MPVDSAAGALEGDGYAIAYDLGRFGEPLDALAREHGTRPLQREIGGRPGIEVGFAPDDEPFAWARIVQVDAGDGRTLTVRVSCASRARCELADRVFDSITIA